MKTITTNSVKTMKPTHVRFQDTILLVSDIVRCEKYHSPSGTPAIKIKTVESIHESLFKYESQEECDHDFEAANDCMTKTYLIFD